MLAPKLVREIVCNDNNHEIDTKSCVGHKACKVESYLWCNQRQFLIRSHSLHTKIHFDRIKKSFVMVHIVFYRWRPGTSSQRTTEVCAFEEICFERVAKSIKVFFPDYWNCSVNWNFVYWCLVFGLVECMASCSVKPLCLRLYQSFANGQANLVQRILRNHTHLQASS